MADTQAAYDELIGRLKEAATLGGCAAVLGWDQHTYMPAGGAAARGGQMALLAKLAHGMATDPRVGELIAAVEGTGLVRDAASPPAVNVREARRAFDRATKLPARLVEELALVTTEAQSAWVEARRADDFAAFRPHLEKVIALKREEADAVGFADHPYDALMDEYEPGMTSRRVSEVFAALAEGLVPLIAAIRESPRRPDAAIPRRDFPVDAQERFAREAAAAIGFDFADGRLDVTAHPFCTGIGPGDTRITTRYNKNFFNEAFFGTLHEAGHGIYEQNLPAAHAHTPLGQAVSLGIHESQSRLWENQVGRGRPFWDHFYPRARVAFVSLKDVNLDDFYFAVNESKPSFIRVEADEATYNLHIILRFELEQKLLTGDLKVGDLPSAWDGRFEELFGIRPASYRDGCLQDIHWSMGGVGYFPTYTLGNLYSAQLMRQAREDLSGLDDDFRRGEFGRLKGWLNEKIHAPGSTYPAEELCRRVTGGGLDPRPLLGYLRDKYGPLYGV